nr:MAG TPA: Protein of unknown function (DUF3138) [Caudoviricetes sp.]
MDKEMLEQFQLIIREIGGVESRLRQEIRDTETRINLKIENEVSKRIESLFDGYKLVHEKQWELERQTEAMKTQIEELNARLAKLESKIAG